MGGKRCEVGSGDRGRALGNEGKLSLGVGNWQGNIQSKQGPHSPGPPEKVDQEVFRSRPVILNSPACGFLILVFNAVASLPYQTTAFMEYNVDVMTRMHPQFSQHLIIIPPTILRLSHSSIKFLLCCQAQTCEHGDLQEGHLLATALG